MNNVLDQVKKESLYIEFVEEELEDGTTFIINSSRNREVISIKAPSFITPGFWNGKIYGNPKYKQEASIYLKGNKIPLTDEQYEEMHEYQMQIFLNIRAKQQSNVIRYISFAEEQVGDSVKLFNRYYPEVDFVPEFITFPGRWDCIFYSDYKTSEPYILISGKRIDLTKEQVKELKKYKSISNGSRRGRAKDRWERTVAKLCAD